MRRSTGTAKVLSSGPSEAAPAAVLGPPPNSSALLLTVINDAPYFERHRRHVAEAAARAGWKTHVALPARSESRKEDLSLNMIDLSIRPGRISPAADLRALLQLIRILDSRDWAVVHAVTLKALILSGIALRLLSLLKRKRIPLVATFPGLGTTFHRARGSSIGGRFRQAVAKWGCLMALAHRPITATFETDADRERVAKLCALSADQTHVTAGTGLDLDVFKPRKIDRAGPFTAVLAGRLLRSKGIDAFVEAARRSSSQNLRWIVAGWRYESPDALTEVEVEALAEEPAIRFLGHVRDMRALLADADVVVLPSTYPEGVPRILIEAAAAGLPMITTDFPGARRLVRDTETGLLLPDASPEAICDAVLRIAARPDRGAAWGAAARRAVEEGGFDETSVQSAFLGIFRSAAEMRS
jgi:glycosyltransferase involved in cell wall biosynthesis